jgi:hypothetical protein
MAAKTAPQIRRKLVSELRHYAVSFDADLPAGHSFSGETPTITVSPAGPTVANKAVSTAVMDVEDHVAVPIGRVLLYSVAAGTAGVEYTFSLFCATDATVSETVGGKTTLRVEAD